MEKNCIANDIDMEDKVHSQLIKLREERENRANERINKVLKEEQCHIEYAITLLSNGQILPVMKIVANRQLDKV